MSLVISLFILTVIPSLTQAIPAFARKYRMSCNTCHAPIPRLKEYGNEFAGNGFVLEDKDAPRYFVESGDDRLDLIRELPFAVRMEGFVKHQTETEKNIDLTTPYNIKLLSGGALTKNIAYYFYFFFSERGEVAGVEDAYIMFNNLFKQDLDIYIGQFQVCDPLFKRELRLTYEDYILYKTKIGDSSMANLAYDRGFMITLGLETGTDIIFELINGNGIGAADDFRTYDNDKYKNFMGRISQGLTDFARIGGFGYYGKEGFDNPNELTMFGGDATLSYKENLELNFQYLMRTDDNPSFETTKPDDEIKTEGMMAELIFMPEGDRSKLYGTLLYNMVDSDDNDADYETFTVHAGYLVKTNLRLIVENTFDILNDENRFVAGFIAAF